MSIPIQTKLEIPAISKQVPNQRTSKTSKDVDDQKLGAPEEAVALSISDAAKKLASKQSVDADDANEPQVQAPKNQEKNPVQKETATVTSGSGSSIQDIESAKAAFKNLREQLLQKPGTAVSAQSNSSAQRASALLSE